MLPSVLPTLPQNHHLKKLHLKWELSTTWSNNRHLIEGHISSDDHPWGFIFFTPQTIPLNSITITKKDTLQSSRLQLVLANASIRQTPKHPQVIILRWFARPHLLLCLTLNCCRWRAVDQIARCGNNLCTKTVVNLHGKACSGSSPIVRCSYILLLHFLWSTNCPVVSSNVGVPTKLLKLF
jgi:hypothetical protein